MYLHCMGLSRWVYWLCWILNDILIQLIPTALQISLLFCEFLKINENMGALVRRGDVVIWTLFLVAYTCSALLGITWNFFPPRSACNIRGCNDLAPKLPLLWRLPPLLHCQHYCLREDCNVPRSECCPYLGNFPHALKWQVQFLKYSNKLVYTLKICSIPISGRNTLGERAFKAGGWRDSFLCSLAHAHLWHAPLLHVGSLHWQAPTWEGSWETLAPSPSLLGKVASPFN